MSEELAKQALKNIEEFDKEAAQVNDLVTFFLELQCALQISHWKTTSFAEHKACEQISGDHDGVARGLRR